MSKLWVITKQFGKAIGIICTPIALCEIIGHPATVVGASMEPTLIGNNARWWENDIVWLSKINTYPKNGEIYTYMCPRDPKVQHIKRVSGSPGDLIQFKARPSFVLNAFEYWMQSDNSKVGQDSRSYGPVNFGLFQAKATFILWPPKRFGSIDKRKVQVQIRKHY